MIEINRNPSRTELRVFAVLLVVFFGLIALWIYRRTGSLPWALGTFSVATAVAVAGFFLPAFLRYVYVGWMTAVTPIGWVVSHVLMAVVFYLVVTPIGLLMRLMGRDPMQRAFERNATSYWQPRTQERDTRRYFRQF